MKQFLITRPVTDVKLDNIFGEAILLVDAETKEEAEQIAKNTPKNEWKITPAEYDVISYTMDDDIPNIQEISEDFATSEEEDFNFSIEE